MAFLLSIILQPNENTFMIPDIDVRVVTFMLLLNVTTFCFVCVLNTNNYLEGEGEGEKELDPSRKSKVKRQILRFV